MKAVLAAIALLLPMLVTQASANTGDELLQDLVRKGMIVHPGGILGGR